MLLQLLAEERIGTIERMWAEFARGREDAAVDALKGALGAR